MILNMMIHKNKELKCFTQPIFTDVEPEKFAIQESRSLQIGSLKDVYPYRHLDLYFLGVFDDETCSIVDVDENGEKLLRKLLNCGAIVKPRLEKAKKEKDDVSSISTDSKRETA